MPDEDETDEKNIIKRIDGTYLINGKTLVFEMNQYFQREIIKDNISKYTTISGFLLEHLKTMPTAGDKVDHTNLQFEIMDMDGNRIDKVLMTLIKK